MDTGQTRQEALEFHKKYHGKMEIKSRVPLDKDSDLELAYTPGVAIPSLEIAKSDELVNIYTNRWNSVAVISNGTAVLGLGNIGAKAALPVMEGKAILFKKFGGVDAYPICVNAAGIDELSNIITSLEPTFGGINLEDIAAPDCFEIEKRLKEKLDIPVFHDDQHGTAIVTLAGLINAAKFTKRNFNDLRIVIFGAGAAGIAISRILSDRGITDIILCDRHGPIYKNRPDGITSEKKLIAEFTNLDNISSLEEAFKDKNTFIGVSSAGLLKKEMIKLMEDNPIIFAMANPVPEIYPDDAYNAGAGVVATGRSDFDNQVNNVLAFPGIFRGALDVEAKDINEAMKIAAAEALAEIVSEENLSKSYIIPKALDLKVGWRIAGAVAQAAVKSGVAQKKLTRAQEEKYAKNLILGDS